MNVKGEVESLEVESETAHKRTLVSVAMKGLGIKWGKEREVYRVEAAAIFWLAAKWVIS